MHSNTYKHRILFRADANSTIGYGHVMRLIGLFEILKESFECVFLINQPDIKIKETVESYCKLIILKSSKENEISEVSSLLNLNDILVLDGYNFREEYQQKIKPKVHKLVVIDDKVDRHFYADLVINHAGEILRESYIREPYTKILTGIEYLIVRKEFLKAALVDRKLDKVDSVFICMGGADPFNNTIKALAASIKCDFVRKIILVTGGAFNNNMELEKLVLSGSVKKQIIYENNINSTRLIELIRLCEIAICPASTIALEVCCVKVGLITGTVIDNQDNIHKFLVNSKCCLSLDDFNRASLETISSYITKMNNIELVKNQVTNQKLFFDGGSVDRIRQEFKLLSK